MSDMTKKPYVPLTKGEARAANAFTAVLAYFIGVVFYAKAPEALWIGYGAFLAFVAVVALSVEIGRQSDK